MWSMDARNDAACIDTPPRYCDTRIERRARGVTVVEPASTVEGIACGALMLRLVV